MVWIDDTKRELHTLLDSMPPKLKPDYELVFALDGQGEDASIGVQRANIYISALSAEFSLVRFPSALHRIFS
jgi:hypothetical protein